MFDARDDDLLGETLSGRYAVQARVARGGFGVVYRGRHLELDAPVAIKALTVGDRYEGEARAAWLSMFQREARTLAALNHPALVRVIDYGSTERAGRVIPWMVLEWLDGVTLEADFASRRGEGRSPREVLELMRPAFDALACAHDAGVSHRDIKPSNLMLVTAKRGAPSMRVIDFGIAKVDDADRAPESNETRTDAPLVAFSMPYAAPEQLTRTRTGPWTDVHALALVITEALAGERAYADASGSGLLESVLRVERPTPARLGLDVGPWETVLARALAKLPTERQPNASALWSELASSVEEAQAAWARSPRARATPRAGSNDETLDGTAPPRATRAPAREDPQPVVTPADTTSTAVMVASVLAPRRRTPWAVIAAAFAVVALFVALRGGTESPHAPPPDPLPRASVTPVEAPAPAPAPAPAAPVVAAPAATTPPPPTPPAREPVARPIARRPLRTRAAVDAGAPAAAPRVEPRLVLE